MIKKLDDSSLTIDRPLHIIYNGPLFDATDISLLIHATFYFVDNDVDALQLYNALKKGNDDAEMPKRYYTMNVTDYVELDISNATIVESKPKDIFNLYSSDDEEETTTETSESNDEPEFENAKNILVWLYFNEDAVNTPIIKPYRAVLTPVRLLNYVRGFPRTLLNINSPQQVYNTFITLMKDKIGIDAYSLYYELILAQLIFCNDHLWRLSKDKCKLYLASYKEAIQKLYPIRALYFENLGKTVTSLPFLDNKEFSSLDNYLLANYNYYINQVKNEGGKA